MRKPVRIAVAGALGRMGRAVAQAVELRPDAALAGLFDRPGSEGSDVGERRLITADEALAGAEVVIDFSTAEAAAALAARLAALGSKAPALVIGATGFTAEQDIAVDRAAGRLALVRSGNFSLGVNLLVALVRRAARTLPADYDIEVFEAHHRRKVDAPSGTALMLGKAAAAGRGQDLEASAERVRDGMTGPRGEGAIGFSVMRGGGIIGEHSVAFIADEEIVTLSHSARDRALFAKGAVQAAVWAAGRPAGLYGMADVLGLSD